MMPLNIPPFGHNGLMRVMQDRYELISEIGRGGMGVVWLGHDRHLDRRVAIKFFNELGTKEQQLRAQREAQVLAGISHPNLVGVYALTTDEASGKLGMVFDYVDGMPLSDLLENGPLPRELISKLCTQLCAGLDALHAAGVVHRDIKPSNLIISRDHEHLTIIDFGLAKSISADVQRLTSTGTMLGTPAYMSPEQFASGTGGPSSDLYSAACVLYEMLTGVQVFVHDSLYMVAQSHLLEPPPTTNNKAFDSFFACALAKEPQARFASAADMEEAFRRAAEGKSILSSAKHDAIPNPSAPNTVPSQFLRHWKMASTVALMAIAAAAAAYFLSNTHPGERQEGDSIDTRVQTIIHEAEQPIHNQKFDEGRRILKSGIAELEAQGAPKLNPLAMSRLYLDYAKYCSCHEGTDGFDSGQAVAAYEKAIPLLNPDSPNYLRHRLALAGQYFQIGDLRKSLALYGELLPDLAKESNVHYDESVGYGHVLLDAGRYKECIEWLEPTSNGLSELSDSHYTLRLRRYLATAYIMNGQPNRAISLLLLHLPLGANDEPVADRLELAYAYALTGNGAESRKFIKAATTQPTWKTHGRQADLKLDLIHAANAAAENKPNEAAKWLEKILDEKDYFEATHGRETANHHYDRISLVYRILTNSASLADRIHNADLKSQFESIRADLRKATAPAGMMLPP